MQINFDCGRGRARVEGGQAGTPKYAAVQQLHSTRFPNYNICFLAFVPFATHDIFINAKDARQWARNNDANGFGMKSSTEPSICACFEYPIAVEDV